MKYVKYGMMVLFLIFVIFYMVHWYSSKAATDASVPEIIISQQEQQLDVSVKDDQQALLKGVVAKDSKDGDITDRLVVESISKFVDKKEHICNITYAVADSDGHVAKATRKIRYVDYTKPRFVLDQPLCFETGSEVNVKDIIGAWDSIDGDISSKVKILSRSISTNISGDNTVTAQVTNSRGDTVTLKSVVIIKPENNLSPVISLSKNIEYLKVGEKFQPEKYVKSVEDSEGEGISLSNVKVRSSSVNTKKAGCYSVEYKVTDGEENEGIAYLTVVVEE